MFVVPLSIPLTCGSAKFILLPCNVLPGDSSHLEGRWEKSQFLCLTRECLKSLNLQRLVEPHHLGFGTQRLRRVQRSPCSRTRRPKPRMAMAFTQVNSSANRQKM